jgi:hypothetical protein
MEVGFRYFALNRHVGAHDEAEFTCIYVTRFNFFSKGFSNVRDTDKDSLNEEQDVISDNQEGVKFSMTPSPKLRSSKKLLGLLTQNRSHLFLSSYPL